MGISAVRRAWTVISRALAHEHGLIPLLKKAFAVARIEGIRGLSYRLLFLGRRNYRSNQFPDYRYVEPGAAAPATSDLSFLIIVSAATGQSSELTATLDSIRQGSYLNWRVLVIAESAFDPFDERVTVKVQEGPPATALGQAISTSDRDYILVLGSGDLLTSDALAALAAAAADGPDVVYGDDDRIGDDGFCDPHFKPDYLPELLISQNYIGRPSAIRRTTIAAVGGIDETLADSAEYDLLLRAARRTHAVAHVPRVLCHRADAAPHANRKLLDVLAAREGLIFEHDAAKKFQRFCYPLRPDSSVSVVMVLREDNGDWRQLAAGIREEIAARSGFELICICAHDAGIDAQGEALIHVSDLSSAMNLNSVAERLDSDILVFVDGSLEATRSGWLDILVSFAQQPEIGVAGGISLDAYRRIRSAGLVFSVDAPTGMQPLFRGLYEGAGGYQNRAASVGNYLATGGRMFAVATDKFRHVGGFGDFSLRFDHAGVDLCLSLAEAGYRHVVHPGVVMLDPTPLIETDDERLASQILGEIWRLRQRHQVLLLGGDRHYNPNLAVDRSDCWPALKNTVLAPRVTRKPLASQRLIDQPLAPVTRREVCIFAHYDSAPRIAPYVAYYIEQLARRFDVIFVSTSETLGESDLAPITDQVCHIIVRKNAGYDFGSWKTGLAVLGERIAEVDQLLFCNDSVFGPLSDLDALFENWAANPVNVFGVTDSFDYWHHLQSYFLLFDGKAIQHPAFAAFWRDVGVIDDKEELVRRYEVGLSRRLADAGLTLRSYVPTHEVTFLNSTHVAWRELICRYRSPFIKVELLRDNPLDVDVSDLIEVIGRETNYPVQLLTDRLAEL